MIPLPQSYQDAVANLPTEGQFPTSAYDIASTGAAAGAAQNESVSFDNALGAQGDLVGKLSGDELDLGWDAYHAYLQSRSDPDSLTPADKTQIDSYNAQVADLKQRFPDQPIKNLDELYQSAADNAKALTQTAAETYSAGTTGAKIGGTLMGAPLGMLEDPTQLGLLMALPVDAEAFGGNLLFRIGKSALTQGALQGGAEAAEQIGNRDFYRAQGMTDDEMNSQLWRSTLGAAAGGAVLTAAGEGIFHGVGKLFSGDTTPAAKQVILDQLDKLNVGSDAHADIANMQEGLTYAAKSPFQDDRVFGASMDDITNRIQNGTYDPYATSPVALNAALDDDKFNYTLPDDVRTELGLPLGNQVSADEVNVSLRSRLAHGMVDSAQDDADNATLRAHQAENDVADFTEQRDAIRAELAKDVPSTEALSAGGLDPNTTAALSDIDQQLGGTLTKRNRVALQARRDSIIASSQGDIDAAKNALADKATQLEQQVRNSSRELNAAQRAQSQHTGEVERLQKIAAQADRERDNLRTSKQGYKNENVTLREPVEPESTAPAVPLENKLNIHSDGVGFDFPIEGGGKIRGEIKPNRHYQVTLSAATTPNKGFGTAAYADLAREVIGRGGVLESDLAISAPVSRVYEKLRDLGFTVEKNPETFMSKRTKKELGEGWLYRVTGAPRDSEAEAAALATRTEKITPAMLDAIRDSRAEMSRPMSDGEVKQKVADAESVSPGGDLEDNVIREYRQMLDEKDLILPKATGEFNDRGEAIYAPSSAREELKDMDDDEAALREILQCLGSGG